MTTSQLTFTRFIAAFLLFVYHFVWEKGTYFSERILYK